MSTSPSQRSLLPSPFPRESKPGQNPTNSPAPNQEDPEADKEIPYIEPDSESLLPPPNFSPFFAVIEDSSTGEHYHPSIHYIFTDDDEDLLTAAAIREQGYDDAQPVRVGRGDGDGEEEEEGEEMMVSPLPAMRPGVKERYIVIDIGADGQSVTEAQSMSREWQALETSVRPAPTWDEEAAAAGGAGLMLLVSGMEIGKSEKVGADLAKEIIDAAKKEVGDDPFAVLDSLVNKVEKSAGAVVKLTGLEQQEMAAVARSRGASLSIV